MKQVGMQRIPFALTALLMLACSGDTDIHPADDRPVGVAPR
jgi:hypothetical protein